MLKNFLISIVSLALAFAAVQVSLGAILKNRAPDIAVTLQPLNGLAAENIVSRELITSVAANQGEFPDTISSRALKWARLAFLAEPTTPVAVAALALNTKKKNERVLMQNAFALSRREQIVTGWMIADSSARNDTKAILNYYDTTLRTNASAAPVLIPVMVNALSNRQAIDPFASLLFRQPPWASEFWERLAASPDSMGNGAILRERLYRRDENRDQYRDLNLVRSLVYAQEFKTAEKLYTLLSGTSSRGILVKNSSFDRQPEFPPLDWELVSTGEYGAAIMEGVLQLSAIQNSGGLFAKQLVKLPEAMMQINVETNDPVPDDVDVVVGLACAETLIVMPRPIRIGIKDQSTIRQINNQRSGCQYYWLDISARASENGNGFDVGIETISLQKK